MSKQETVITRVDSEGARTMVIDAKEGLVTNDQVPVIMQRMTGDEGDTIGIGDGSIAFTVHTSAVRALLEAHDAKLQQAQDYQDLQEAKTGKMYTEEEVKDIIDLDNDELNPCTGCMDKAEDVCRECPVVYPYPQREDEEV